MKLTICFLAAIFLCGSCSCTKDNTETPAPPTPGSTLPELSGMVTYHSYTSYDTEDSKMYIYDFKNKELITISKDSWGIRNPMNGSFSPDGKLIAFMGKGTTGTWDIFLYDITKGERPVNLTPDGIGRDEDPKFSYDGKSIIFKRDEQLAEITVATGNMKILTPGVHNYSMPFYSTDNNDILYSGSTDGTNRGSYIGIYSKATEKSRILYNRLNVTEYYPITRDSKSFYYSASYSETSNYDQLYLGYFSGIPAKKLPFNTPDADYSDAVTVGGNWMMLCSTRGGGKGQYDLYIANIEDGAIFSLDDYDNHINSPKNELGACYNSNNPKIVK